MENLIVLFFQGGGTELISSILPFLLIILVFYFLILRPQQKKQKERQKLLEAVKKGDRVITTGGIHGTIEGIDGNDLLVKIADNVKVKMDRSAIGTVLSITDK